MRRICTLSICLAFLCAFDLSAQSKKVIKVGAKHFNEGYILSEMIAVLLEDAGFAVERKFNLGGTAVSFEALRNGAIDIYPEYTGTITSEILKSRGKIAIDEINTRVKARFNLEISKPYGFNNTYALVITARKADSLNINDISDLRNHSGLRFGLSYEFMKRQDGWDALAAFYDLPHDPFALEHGLAYQAILENRIDISDAYSTDGEINRYKLILLEDDKEYFPNYHAVSFYRAALPDIAKRVIEKLNSSISEEEMQSLNSLALFERKSYAEIARHFLVGKKLVRNNAKGQVSDWKQILDKSFVHLKLTMLALIGAVIAAVPLGVFIYKNPILSKAIIYLTGILQTIPSIALLALMIPLFGIGIVPALVALFLYALLPILRNTVIGLTTVDPELKKVASAIGLNDRKTLMLIEVPLAMPTIITGIRTAAVINVGTATLAAFIGAGGLGEFIVTGLALNNTSLILKGALPAALLAILIELVFEGLDRALVPKHLRNRSRF
ncbi:MAG: glycine betaine ABC transporter substrate-binding protein [Chryseosolibacter sp.]